MIKVKFPDGREAEYEQGTTAMDVAKSISHGLAKNVLAAKVNGEVWDASRVLPAQSDLALLTWNDDEGKATQWHSSAHLMAEAIQFYYPDAKFAIGPSIENGFYYDIDLGGKVISTDDFPKLEKKMLELAREKNSFERKEISKVAAIKYFEEKGDHYKLELIDGLVDGDITFYTQGDFTDLCRGPHIPDTGYIKAVKLLNVAGAYWRGDENREQLTRIYGITFPKQKELTEHLERLEEAKKRDHRKLGKELGLFTFSENVGMGLPLWLPNGTDLRQRLTAFLAKAQKEMGYDQVMTPHIGNVNLYKTSGHLDKYGEDSFQPIETPKADERFFLKPMNCPHHCEIFKATPHSYRDLPVRMAEFGTVYRYEQSGELHGLTRVRGFTQDDAHIFCTPEQVKAEFLQVIDLIMYVFKSLGFEDFLTQISLRDPETPEKYIGSSENWEKAERAIIEATEEKGIKTVVEYGEAAFYGPKLDFMVKDALGRKWQLGTIQVDYNLPERFELEYTGDDNAKHRPVMIHRAPFGSLERFVAILIEHTGGKFPLWLTPEQIAILPVSEKFNDHAHDLLKYLNNCDIRGFVDDRNEKVGRKIRDTELKKVPFMVVLGEREIESGLLPVRKQGHGDQGQLTKEDFVKLIQDEIASAIGSIDN